MVKLMAALLNIKDHSVESIDLDDQTDLEPEPSVARPNVSASSRAEEHDFLRRVWQAVKRLPAEQRDTFCFRFQDYSGNDFFSLLIEFGIATLPQIAQGFSRSAQGVRRLRSRTPLTLLGLLRSLEEQGRNPVVPTFPLARRTNFPF
jgi:hypothetical protein